MVFLFIVTAASVVAFFVALEAFFRPRLLRTRSVAEMMPGRSLLVGAVNFVFFGGAALALLGLADQVANDPLKAALTIPGLIIVVVLAAALSLGLGGVVLLVSERLAARAPLASGPISDAVNWKRTAMGALALGRPASRRSRAGSFCCPTPACSGWAR
jgi:hypothetical protein